VVTPFARADTAANAATTTAFRAAAPQALFISTW
jgi:hypothetical protein